MYFAPVRQTRDNTNKFTFSRRRNSTTCRFCTAEYKKGCDIANGKKNTDVIIFHCSNMICCAETFTSSMNPSRACIVNDNILKTACLALTQVCSGVWALFLSSATAVRLHIVCAIYWLKLSQLADDQ